MAKKGSLDRRSLLSRVGGVSLTLGAAAVVTGCATTEGPGYTGLTDTDQGRYANRAGYGRGVRNAPRPQQTRGVTDIDPGDRPGAGRGGSRGTCTDSDSQATNYRTDRPGHGQRCR